MPKALAYYKRLERESDHILHISPFKAGRAPVPLHFDFSYDYYPTAYYRPGAVIDVYRLNDCVQGYGSVGTKPYGYTGLEGWVPARLIGGWIDFRRLPNGAPLIAAWQIRAPIPLQSGQRRKLYGFKEREGRVINVFTADGHPVTLPN